MIKLSLIWLLPLILLGCNNSQKPLSQTEKSILEIDSLETLLFQDAEAKIDRQAGMQLVKAYTRYYQNSDKDSLAVDMLFKAGEVSMGIGQGNMAVKYFSTIVKDHTGFSKAPEALFLTGFCEENLNRDTAEARFYYEKFISKYPEHNLTEDAQFSIQNMGLSDKELIKLFEKNLNSES